MDAVARQTSYPYKMKVQDMTQRYRKFQRSWGTWYAFDNATGKLVFLRQSQFAAVAFDGADAKFDQKSAHTAVLGVALSFIIAREIFAGECEDFQRQIRVACKASLQSEQLFRKRDFFAISLNKISGFSVTLCHPRAGGCLARIRSRARSCVQLLDLENKQWQPRLPTPAEAQFFSSRSAIPLLDIPRGSLKNIAAVFLFAWHQALIAAFSGITFLADFGGIVANHFSASVFVASPR
jgi:hypothetical protein